MALELMHITTTSGQVYALNPRLISCIARRPTSSLGDASAQLCTVFWMGGGSMSVTGAYYDELIAQWTECIRSWTEYGD